MDTELSKIENKYFQKYWLGHKYLKFPLKQRLHRWQHILAIFNNTKLSYNQKVGMFPSIRTVNQVIHSRESIVTQVAKTYATIKSPFIDKVIINID